MKQIMIIYLLTHLRGGTFDTGGCGFSNTINVKNMHVCLATNGK